MDDDKKKKRTIIIAVIIVLLFLLSSSIAYYLYATKKNGGASGTGVAQGPAVSFTIKPAVVMPGERAKLVWSTNATACFAVGDQSSWFSVSDPSGGSTDTQELRENKTYTITCTSPVGTTTKSVTVSVVHPESGGTSAYGAKSPNAGTPIECIDLKKDLALGSKGDPVSALQRFLATHNFLVSAPSGVYGTSTAAAVKIFQTSQKLSANGSAGLLTRTAIKKISCKWGATPEYTCFDGIKNGDETGVDVGGHCITGALITCTDGIQNGDETGVDIGGHCKNADGSGPLYTCYDGIQNGDETGIDIGGHCGNGSTYTCFDGIKNGDETGVDVGGHCGGDIGSGTGAGTTGGGTPGQCKTARDCTTGQTCSSAGVCIPKGSCKTATDCASGQSCSTTGVCITAGTCKVAADCISGQTCSPSGVCTGGTGTGSQTGASGGGTGTGTGWGNTQWSRSNTNTWGTKTVGGTGTTTKNATTDTTDPSYTPRVNLTVSSPDVVDATGNPIPSTSAIIVSRGSTVNISWNVSNANTCFASGLSWPTNIISLLVKDPSNRIRGATSSRPIATADTISLSCTGAGGNTTRNVKIGIIPDIPAPIIDATTPAPPVITFLANIATTTIHTLKWSTTAPKPVLTSDPPISVIGCYAKDPMILSFDPNSVITVAGWDSTVKNLLPNGTRTLTVTGIATSTAMTYTIVCETDKGGLASKSSTLIVNP